MISNAFGVWAMKWNIATDEESTWVLKIFIINVFFSRICSTNIQVIGHTKHFIFYYFAATLLVFAKNNNIIVTADISHGTSDTFFVDNTI
jgi:hypothetical protein